MPRESWHGTLTIRILLINNNISSNSNYTRSVVGSRIPVSQSLFFFSITWVSPSDEWYYVIPVIMLSRSLFFNTLFSQTPSPHHRRVFSVTKVSRNLLFIPKVVLFLSLIPFRKVRLFYRFRFNTSFFPRSTQLCRRTSRRTRKERRSCNVS